MAPAAGRAPLRNRARAALTIAVVSQPINLHIGPADDGCELGVGKQQPAEPEPVLADGAIESTVLGRIGGEPVKMPIRGSGASGRKVGTSSISRDVTTVAIIPGGTA